MRGISKAAPLHSRAGRIGIGVVYSPGTIFQPKYFTWHCKQGGRFMRIRTWVSAPVALVIAICGICFGTRAQSRAAGAPPPSIHTFSTEDIASTGFFYVGGQYVGAPGTEVMDGAEYVEVMVPKKIRHPYPIVFFHGAGQTGTDWLQTPDNRPGWAYYLIAQGYTLYMVDYPARGRSAYVPGVDGALTIRTVNDLESIWTNVKEKGNFPL